jgi:small subunit ribosomal protein S21
MIIVDCSKGIEGALKVYKSKVRNTKQLELLRDRQSFVKPSIKERIQKLKAIYKQRNENRI